MPNRDYLNKQVQGDPNFDPNVNRRKTENDLIKKVLGPDYDGAFLYLPDSLDKTPDEKAQNEYNRISAELGSLVCTISDNSSKQLYDPSDDREKAKSIIEQMIIIKAVYDVIGLPTGGPTREDTSNFDVLKRLVLEATVTSAPIPSVVEQAKSGKSDESKKTINLYLCAIALKKQVKEYEDRTAPGLTDLFKSVHQTTKIKKKVAEQLLDAVKAYITNPQGTTITPLTGDEKKAIEEGRLKAVFLGLQNDIQNAFNPPQDSVAMQPK